MSEEKNLEKEEMRKHYEEKQHQRRKGSGRKKVWLSVKRYSRKRTWLIRKRLTKQRAESAMQKDIQEPSTSGGRRGGQHPLISVSSDKESEITSSDDSLQIEGVTKTEPAEQESHSPSGSAIVDMEYVISQLQKEGDHSINRENCGIRYMKKTGEKRSGLRTTLIYTCTMCNYRCKIRGQPEKDDEMGINESAVAGTILSGGSFKQMEEFLASMNVPCMSRRQFTLYHDKIVKHLIIAAEEEMTAAAEEEKRLAIERGDVLPVSKIPHIPVVADGSWLKRSYQSGTYNSSSGVGAIIGYHTRKVLFIGVRNKRCRICFLALKKNEVPRNHACFKNWSFKQASTAMESDAILEGFRTSIEKRGLVYSTLIADGDSSAYKKILDADPYKNEIRVKKVECTNHLLRNFCRKMKRIAKKTPPGPLRGIVEKGIWRMRADIVKAAQFRDSENKPVAQKIRALYSDIENMPSHVFGDHAACAQLQNFCDGHCKPDERNIVPELKNLGRFQEITELLRPLLAHSESLLYNTSNNTVESFNGIIAKYTGGKRLHLGDRGSYTGRCAAAVLQYNTKEALVRLHTAMKKKPGITLRNLGSKMKKEEVKRTEKQRETPSFKHTRKQFHAGTDADYGPNAEKPDIAEVIFHFEKEKHMEMLRKWQNEREDIERETIGQINNG